MCVFLFTEVDALEPSCLGSCLRRTHGSGCDIVQKCVSTDFFCRCSVFQGTVRDKQVSISGEDRWLCVGPHAGNPDLRQNAEASERRVRELRHKVSLFDIILHD